jgi:hypothetical protein
VLSRPDPDDDTHDDGQAEDRCEQLDRERGPRRRECGHIVARPDGTSDDESLRSEVCDAATSGHPDLIRAGDCRRTLVGQAPFFASQCREP